MLRILRTCLMKKISMDFYFSNLSLSLPHKFFFITENVFYPFLIRQYIYFLQKTIEQKENNNYEISQFEPREMRF